MFYFRMDELAEREKRDAEINRALELANNIFKKSADQPERNNDEENIDQLIGNKHRQR